MLVLKRTTLIPIFPADKKKTLSANDLVLRIPELGEKCAMLRRVLLLTQRCDSIKRKVHSVSVEVTL